MLNILLVIFACYSVPVPAGHNMMVFHVPNNVSAYIKCGSRSACYKREAGVGGFSAWFSCPVCAYRICTGCASVDIPDFADRNRGTVEDLLTRQFRNFGKDVKVRASADEENVLPGQVG